MNLMNLFCFFSTNEMMNDAEIDCSGLQWEAMKHLSPDVTSFFHNYNVPINNKLKASLWKS